MAGRMQQAMDLEDLVDLVLRAQALGDLVHAVGDQRSADPAGRTEAAAFVREEVREIARHFEHVAMRAEDHESARRRHVLESDAARKLVHPRQTPEGPLTCTACALPAPQSWSTCSTETPKGYS
jgi:hypothetical protein